MENFLWVERYRPHTVRDTVLPDQLKATFQQFVDQRNVPNLLLVGPPGVGKTTVAKAMLDELKADYCIFNGSLDVDKDLLRNQISQFASSVSLTDQGRKYVILDEADYLNPAHVQPALRNFMETFSANCGFILTANIRSRILDALQSRCSVIEFTIPNAEKAKLGAQFFKRAMGILEKGGIECVDRKVVAELVKKFFPDFRRVLNELQRYSACGRIDTGILATLQDASLRKLIEHMRTKDFTKVRRWIADNSDMNPSEFYRALYDTAADYVELKSIPMLILVLAKYGYQNAMCADSQINTAACLVELMAECEFRK